ncbi:MAG: hypothetical protein GF411_12290 [Candidatus Lokiarchaeota archaeon]|nr:hypothetical protein [Candidatus Lokiarchaeota archaeon]
MMSPRATISIDWLQKGRLIDDAVIIKRLIVDRTDESVSEKIEPELFESKYDLKPLKEYEFDWTKHDVSLGLSSLRSILNRPLYIQSDEPIVKKLESMIPRGFEHTRSFAYTIGRIITKDVPSLQEMDLITPGLDPLSAAIITINNLAEITGESIKWLLVLWQFHINKVKTELLSNINESLVGNSTVEETIELLKSILEELSQFSPSDPAIWNLRSQIILLESHDKTKLLLEVLPKLDLTIDEIRDYHREKHQLLETADDFKKEYNRIATQDSSRATFNKFSEIIEKENPTETDLKLLATILPKKAPTLDYFKSRVSEMFQPAATRSKWMIVGVRPDGVLVDDFNDLIDVFKERINFLNYQDLIDICRYLNTGNELRRITAEEIENALQISKRGSFRHLAKIEQIINTTTIVNLQAMGLKFRYVVAKKRRPLLKSDGLVEKVHFTGNLYQIGTLHVEPEKSEGPDKQEMLQVTGNSLFFSYRLDLYNQDKKKWRYPEELKSHRLMNWMFREVTSSSEKVIPTQREIDVMSVLWGSHEYWHKMKWLLDSIKIPKRTSDYILKHLSQKRLISVIHHPIMDYCGIPNGYHILARGDGKKSVTDILKDITRFSNYAQGFYNQDTNELFSTIRMPIEYGEVIIGEIADILEKNNFEYMIANIERQWTYYHTVLQRIYDESDCRFVDPWK